MAEDDEDEDLDELVPDEMDYTHEDSFRYLELQRQREEQNRLIEEQRQMIKEEQSSQQ